jgi:hypothetical protein
MVGAGGFPSQKIISVEVKNQESIDSSLSDALPSTGIPQIVITG